MYFRKITPFRNFRYNSDKQSLLNSGEIEVSIDNLGNGVSKFSLEGKGWKQMSQAGLSEDVFKDDTIGSFTQTEEGFECVLGDKVLLRTHSEQAFGVCGKKWILNFEYNENMLFYGLGEKNNGFEKTGIKTKFWNTDVWGDFDMNAVINGVTDSMYISVPYLLIKQYEGCIGILVNNPYAVFMDIASKERIGQLQDAEEREPPRISIGSTDGTPELFFIIGKTVKEVTAKLQKLSGTTPLPPLWALGNHQCRFGYESMEDMEELDEKFGEHKIPCDGLWLDIDYMEHLKVFTYDETKFEHREARVGKLLEKGRKVIPILDPGVKQEEGYHAFDEGVKEDVFCKTAEGMHYTGYVWPGKTAFPDYSTEKGRDWWSRKVKDFANEGIYGAWLDMNDPSVGSAELEDMLFNDGQESHDSYHNQYALGMQQASRDGFLAAHPDERTFLLSRSGFIGTSQHAAVWTGDNYSNTHHLKGAIPLSLNLSLSGIPFNGPDVPGFGGDATEELAIAWHKAGFLFPFFRNHCAKHFVKQEPWSFSTETCGIVGDYIRLRYKLLPYLYNVFNEQEADGHPVMRPLFYEFANSSELNLDKVDDQFLIGDSILQAPVLDENEFERKVLLPGSQSWFGVLEGEWLDGDGSLEVRQEKRSTPIYFKEGSIVPMQKGVREDQGNDLSEVELHVFLRNESSGNAVLDYIFDDGSSFEYKNGKRSRLQGVASVEAGKLKLVIDNWDNQYTGVNFCIVAYDAFAEVEVVYEGEVIASSLTPYEWEFGGNMIGNVQSEWVELK